MKDIVPKDSRYIPFTQQKYCCVPASLSIVMYKHGMRLIPQELLGSYLGLTVPKKVENLFWNVKTGKRPPAGYGTRVDDAGENQVNEVFARYKIPLRIKLLHISQFNDEDFGKYLTSIEKLNKDVLVCFDHAVLKKEKDPQGHVSVVDRAYINQGMVRLIDPAPTQPKWRMVKIKELLKAMRVYGNNKSAGFWELMKHE